MPKRRRNEPNLFSGCEPPPAPPNIIGYYERAGRQAETSKAAAQSVNMRGPMLRILEVMQMAGADGLTDEEGQIITEINGNTYRPSRVKLVDLGRIEKTTMRRKTKSGRSAVVWRINNAIRSPL